MWLAFLISTTAQAQTNSQSLYLQCLTNFETYAETVWHPATYSGAPADSGYWGDGGAQAGNNGGIRGNGGIAVAYATLVVALPNDPRTATRLSRIRQALNYNAATHSTGTNVSVNGYQWGWGSGSLDTDCSTCNGCADWQSGEWAGSTGLACLLVQSNLPAATVAAVQRIIASEATHRASVAPCTLPLAAGDTKAEENAWDGNPVALAAAWLSTSNGAASWQNAAQSYLVNTYTVADTSNDPLAAWVSTVTLFPEFALENHGFYHPTYEMVAGMSSGDSQLMAQLANPTVAAQLLPYAEHNVSTVWSTNLSPMLLDSGDFAYPAGIDWELHDYEQNSYVTWMAAHFNNPVARWADGQLAQLVRYRQIVNANGEFIGVSGGGFYREAVEARRTAIAWLQWANADHPAGPTNAPVANVSYFPDVGIITQRSAWGFTSLSFGSRIMSLVEAATTSFPSNPFTATPALPGGFGNGSLGNATSALLVNFTTNNAGFTAQLLLQNGANGQTRVYVNSCGEAVGMVEVPLPASGVTGTTAGCFTNGIENDPLTGGSRLIQWQGGATTITNLTGVSTNIAGQWACVSGHYGFAAGPGGSLRYIGAGSYNRLGAAQDYLHAVPQSKFGARYAVWFPTKNAVQTAALAGQITWTTNAATSEIVLTFPGNGVTNNITASLASGNATWTADANGNWSDPANWLNGAVADGANFTADFSTLNITANRTVTLDSPRTTGTLAFGDPSGAQNWILVTTNGSTLTLSATTPAIVVNQNTATINAPLAAAAGFTKSGAGTLVLVGSNSISGTINLDSGSTSKNDGAFCVANNAALAGASALSIRNNNSGSSTFQLDGSAGSLTISQNISVAGRNVAVPTIENIAGNNTLAGNLSLVSGGGFYWIQSDRGTLTNRGTFPLTTPGGTRILTFLGSGNHVVTGVITNGSGGGTVALVKTGSGSLELDGVNTYTGTTTISNGVLSGTGTIVGPITIMPVATLSPGGNSIGTLTVNNALTNNGTARLRLQKSGSALTNDALAGVSTLVVNSALQLTLSGDPITVGDSFKLFSAANYKVFPTGIVPPTPGTNLVWNTNTLSFNGTLAVALGNPKPQFSQITVTETNLTLSGFNGAAGAGFSVIASTNLALALASWSLIGTGNFDGSGNFALTSPLPSNRPQQFFGLRIP